MEVINPLSCKPRFIYLGLHCIVLLFGSFGDFKYGLDLDYLYVVNFGQQ